MKRPQAIAAIWAACLIWGVAFPLTKLALHDVSPMLFTATRFVLAGFLVVPNLMRASRDEWQRGAILGLLLAVAFVMQTVGLGLTTSARAAFLSALYILLVPLLLLVAWRTIPDRWSLIGIAIALVGIALLTGGVALNGFNLGDGLNLACAVLFAIHLILTGRFAQRTAPVQLMSTQIAVAALVTLVAAPMLETPRLIPTPLALGVIGYEAVFASIIAIRLQLVAQQILSPTYAALVFSMEPVIASAAGFALLGEVLAPVQWLGGVAILAGTVLPEVMRRRNEPAPG